MWVSVSREVNALKTQCFDCDSGKVGGRGGGGERERGGGGREREERERKRGKIDR